MRTYASMPMHVCVCVYVLAPVANLNLFANLYMLIIAIISQNQSTQRYLPNVGLGDEQLKQMIKGVGAGEINWRQRAKQEVTDVKTELAKLNTSKFQCFLNLFQIDY